MNEPPADIARYAGCLIGQCLGDALGFVVEGYPPATCHAYVDDYLRAGRAGEMGRDPFPFGQYTDDSQLARELVQSYVDCKSFDPDDYGRRIADIFVSGRIVGRGWTTEAAALRLAAGVPWNQAGTPAPAAGNGSAMRAGPVGLMFPDNPDSLVAAARDQGRITHADPRCNAGATAVAGAVALMLQNPPPDSRTFVDTLAAWCTPLDAGFGQELCKLPGWLRMSPEEAAPEIARAGAQPGLSDRWAGISPFVVSSVLWSIYSVLRTPDDYWATVCTAIAVGGDVDTTAAMAGAISGARLGLGSLPDRLARRVNDRGAWGYEKLVDLAGACHAVAAAG